MSFVRTCIPIQVPSNSLVPAAATVGSFALNSPESVSSGGQVPIPSYKKHHKYAKGQKVNKNLPSPSSSSSYARAYGADENDAYPGFPGYNSYSKPEDEYDDEGYPKTDVENRSLQRLADDVTASSANKSSALERRGADEPSALLSPTSPTTPSSPSAYGRLKRKLHSLLLETRIEEQTASSSHVISQSLLQLHQTSHAPRQPTPPGHFPRQLEAATAPEFRSAEEPSSHHRTGEGKSSQDCLGRASPATSTTVAARDNAAPSSEAVNHRPRRRWAALHSALVQAKAEAVGEAAPESSSRPKSPDVRAAPPSEQRLPKKRRSIRFDRTDEPPSATSRDTDTKAVVHVSY